MKLVRLALGSVLFLTLYASSSMAQVQRTFASAVGTDSNPCSRSAPCRTLAQAISQTNAGGEVVVLDSAGYGPVTITKSISITAAPGSYAGISVFSGDGIDINTQANQVVTLRGLTLNNQGSLGNAILFNSGGGTLRVESCVLRGFTGGGSYPSGNGILFLSAGNLVIRDTVISDCLDGIFTNPGSGTVYASIDRVTIDGGVVGVDIEASGTGTSLAAIRDSSVSGSRQAGIRTVSLGSTTALLDVDRCLIANGNFGLVSSSESGVSAMSISNCLISHNTGAGFDVGLGTNIYTFGNNIFAGNGANIGSLTPSSTQ